MLDDEDPQIEEYRRTCHEGEIIVFSKTEAAGITDAMDIQTDRRGVVYARNAAFGIAEGLGLTHFLELDDDYSDFAWRWVEGDMLMHRSMRHLDEVFDAVLDFLDVSGALTVTMAQGGDYIGGALGRISRHETLRKAMNTFFCRTDRPFRFLGRLNEDVNAYLTYGARGGLMLTLMCMMVNQVDTQQSAGGLTEVYLDYGTWVKSFYSVMCAPSCCRVGDMHGGVHRIHHLIDWSHACPLILPESARRTVRWSPTRRTSRSRHRMKLGGTGGRAASHPPAPGRSGSGWRRSTRYCSGCPSRTAPRGPSTAWRACPRSASGRPILLRAS